MISQPSMEPAGLDPFVGTVIAGRYQILSRISQGGMGVVYKARHTGLNNLVAIKVLLQNHTTVDQKRFRKEAQLASKVSHPNTVYIADFGVLDNGNPYLVMEFVAGPTLKQVLEPGRVDVLRACRIAVQIARGMQTVHDKGIVHRGQSSRRKNPPTVPWCGFSVVVLGNGWRDLA